MKNNVTLSGWTDAAVAIVLSSSIHSSIDASKTKGNKIKYISYTISISNILFL